MDEEELSERLEEIKDMITTEKMAQLSDEEFERVAELLDELEGIIEENEE